MSASPIRGARRWSLLGALFALSCVGVAIAAEVAPTAQPAQPYRRLINRAYGVTYVRQSDGIASGLMALPFGVGHHFWAYGTLPPGSNGPFQVIRLEWALLQLDGTTPGPALPLQIVSDGATVHAGVAQIGGTRRETVRVKDLSDGKSSERDMEAQVAIYTATITAELMHTLAQSKRVTITVGDVGIDTTSPFIRIEHLQALEASLRATSEMLASPELIPYRSNGKYGYANTRGELVIPARYDAAERFSEGRARVAIDKPAGLRWLRRYGYIDTAGAEVIAPIYSDASPFVSGVAQVRRAFRTAAEPPPRWNLIDADGISSISNKLHWYTQIPLPSYDSAQEWELRISDGRIPFLQPDAAPTGKQPKQPPPSHWGYLDTGGQFAIAPSYDLAFPFRGGSATVLRGRQALLIDPAGTERPIKLDRSMTLSGPFSEGLATVKTNLCRKNDDGEKVCGVLWGYVDESGRLAIASRYANAGRMSEGLAAVVLTSDALSLDESLAISAAATRGNVYIDRSGIIGPSSVFPPSSEQLCVSEGTCSIVLGPFRNGVARIDVTARSTAAPATSRFTTQSYFMDRSGHVYWDGLP